jgi:deoxyribose-phosphate aldolase
VTLTIHLNDVLQQLLSSQSRRTISKDQLISTIDLTLLDPDASAEALALLADRAQTNHVAAICVFPEHLGAFKRLSHVHLATVINFPHGNNDLLACLAELDQAINSGAKEIDYVFPYQSYLTGNRQHTLNQSDVIIQACKKRERTVKVILETGAFTNMESVYQVSKELIGMGSDFIKTSTGKTSQGATLPDVFAILSAIKDTATEECPCGLKVSGGVKTPEQARNFAHLAEFMLGKKISADWFRIGASSLLSELLNSK